MLRNILLYLLLFKCTFLYTQVAKINCPLLVTLETGQIKKNLDKNIVKLKITIRNTADTSFVFYHRSFTWENSLRFSKDTFYRDYDIVTHEYVQAVELKRNESIIFQDDFIYKSKLYSKSFYLKVGLRVINDSFPELNTKHILTAGDTSEIKIYQKAFLNHEKWLYDKLEYCSNCKDEDYMWSKPVLTKFKK
jgi:hypothetical protein